MSLKVYRDQILKPVVKPWLLEGQAFVVDEDGDSGHGKAKTRNIVRLWKKTSCSTSSNAPHPPIFHQLKTAGNLLNNTWQKLRTGMIAPRS